MTVVANAIALAMDGYGIATELHWKLHTANTVFVEIFVVELLLRISAAGPIHFWGDMSNVVDAAVVVAAVVEIASSDTGFASTFRVLRLLRVVKLLRWGRLWHRVHFRSMYGPFLTCSGHFRFRALTVVVNTTVQSIKGVSTLFFLGAIVLAVLGLVGMQFFGGTYNFGEETATRATFDSFADAMLTMFCIIIGQMMTASTLDAMRAHGFAACLFFVVVLVIGTCKRGAAVTKL
jgi:hypothetical protein